MKPKTNGATRAPSTTLFYRGALDVLEVVWKSRSPWLVWGLWNDKKAVGRAECKSLLSASHA